jgi:hypothetical protein
MHTVRVVVIVVLASGAGVTTTYAKINRLAILNEVSMFESDSVASRAFLRSIDGNTTDCECDWATFRCGDRCVI